MMQCVTFLLAGTVCFSRRAFLHWSFNLPHLGSMLCADLKSPHAVHAHYLAVSPQTSETVGNKQSVGFTAVTPLYMLYRY